MRQLNIDTSGLSGRSVLSSDIADTSNDNKYIGYGLGLVGIGVLVYGIYRLLSSNDSDSVISRYIAIDRDDLLDSIWCTDMDDWDDYVPGDRVTIFN